MGLLSGDIHRLKESWKCIENKPGLAQQIFRDCFTLAPQLKEIFGINAPNDQLQNNPDFIRHTNTYARFLDSIVNSMPDESIVLLRARRVGAEHARMITQGRIHGNFRAEYWNVVTASTVKMIGINLGRVNGRTEATWRQFLLRIVLEMQVHFYKEQLKFQGVDNSTAGSEEHSREDQT